MREHGLKLLTEKVKLVSKGSFNSANRFVNLALLTQCSCTGTDI